jgi:predicted dehydrogenase
MRRYNHKHQATCIIHLTKSILSIFPLRASKAMNRNRTVPRRDFLKTAGIVAAGSMFGVPEFVPGRVFGEDGNGGANERLTLGLIGVGGRGSEHLRAMVERRKRGILNVAALCDVDEKRLERASELAGPQVATYRDYRELLSRKDIDAVIIATPDHWHGVHFTQAAELGKHIYCETPACSTIEEGKAMVAAAKKTKIVTQIGAQGRSRPESYLMHRFLANGAIGKINRVDCWHSVSPTEEIPTADTEAPPELDYELWLGPLRWRPYNPHFSHGNFRWSLDSGGGQLATAGSHLMSLALHWLNADGTEPVTVEAKGSSPSKGLWDAAVEMKVTYTFKKPDWVLTWNQPGEPFETEDRNEDEAKITRASSGATYRGENGEAHHWGGEEDVWAERKVREWNVPNDAAEVVVPKISGHYEDWFNGIQTGERTVLNIEAAVAVANLCILGNLSFLLGRKLQWDQAKGEIIGDEQARRLMARPERYPYDA